MPYLTQWSSVAETVRQMDEWIPGNEGLPPTFIPTATTVDSRLLLQCNGGQDHMHSCQNNMNPYKMKLFELNSSLEVILKVEKLVK